jgi:outer membrane protein TolC
MPDKEAPALSSELPPPLATGPPGLSPSVEKTVVPVVKKAFNAPGLPQATPVGNKPLPINLATTLRLANVRSLDIAIAAREVEIANAALLGANVLWFPNLDMGVDYVRHTGIQQTIDGPADITSRGSLYLGGLPQAIFSLSDAIFVPLAARQVVAQREAELQSTTNDTVASVAFAYFDALQSRAELAAAEDVYRQARELVRKTEELAPGIVPRVEVARARSQLARNEQLIESSLQRWRNASAEVVRVTRLDPTTLIEPLEPPQLMVTLIDPQMPLMDLLTIAWASRPELAASQAVVRGSVERLRQEQWRPLLPNIVLRGAGTVPPYPMMFGAFASGVGGSLSNFGIRGDWDVEAIWELRNLGLGNLALIRGARATVDQAELRVLRTQDLVAREVVQAQADLQSAYVRVGQAERELRDALITSHDSIIGVGQTKRVAGNILILVIRPQEAVAAIQALFLAYQDYFGAVADYNRAEFALYRALGNPAQLLNDLGNKNSETARPIPAVPPMFQAPLPNGNPAGATVKVGTKP